MLFEDWDWSFDEEEFWDELFSPPNLPIVGPWIGYATGNYLPRFTEESIAATIAQSSFIYALGASARFGAAAFIAGRRVVPVAAAAGIVYDTVTNPTDNPFTRGWHASPTAFLFGDHYWQQHGVQEGTRVAFSEMAKNFGFNQTSLRIWWIANGDSC